MHKTLPPGYRIVHNGYVKALDLLWLPDVGQWRESVPSELGKSLLDSNAKLTARPNPDGAPPGYRPVNHPAQVKEGMLLWKNDEWTDKPILAALGMTTGKEANPMIEPAPPNNYEWINEGGQVFVTDFAISKDGRQHSPKGGKATANYIFARKSGPTFSPDKPKTITDDAW
jgi:hypothetical protein